MNTANISDKLWTSLLPQCIANSKKGSVCFLCSLSVTKISHLLWKRLLQTNKDKIIRNAWHVKKANEFSPFVHNVEKEVWKVVENDDSMVSF